MTSFVPRSGDGREQYADSGSADGVHPTTGDTALLEPPPEPTAVPRPISRRAVGADRVFRWGLAGVSGLVLALTGAIGVLLGYQIFPTLNFYGWDFLVTSRFDPSKNQFGILNGIIGTVVIAVIALVVAVPLSLCISLFITEFAPRPVKVVLVWVIDLMAAVPSLIFGAWGLFQLSPQLEKVSRWLDSYLGWIPIFDIPGFDSRSPLDSGYQYAGSALIAGVVVAMMVIPVCSSIMRNVFDQAPIGEREGALALGATRWGVIRAVVLPFGRGGMIGGIMLGLGRALGETIAVSLILAESFKVKLSITQSGGITISSFVAGKFNSATAGTQLNSLLAAGFVLFVMTLAVNTGAAVVVARSRSGAGVDA